MVVALRSQSDWYRQHDLLDEADAVLEAIDIYEKSGCDYFATLKELNARIDLSRMTKAGPLSLARHWLRRNWKMPPGINDRMVAKLYKQSEWERSHDLLDEADAFLVVVDIYEKNKGDYRTTLAVLGKMIATHGFSDALDLTRARDWFRRNWIEYAPPIKPPTEPAPKKSGLFGRR